MSNTHTPPVGTQAERDLDSRLDVAITTSTSLIEEALKQLAKPCTAPEEQFNDEDDILTPIDLAIPRSALLLEEARTQLASPSIAPVEFTEVGTAESKAAQAWERTYRQIEQMNDVRSDTSEDLTKSILNDIEEADEDDARIERSSVTLRSLSDFVQSSSSFREEKRAKRLSRACGGPKVAAVVAKIEAIDDAVSIADSKSRRSL